MVDSTNGKISLKGRMNGQPGRPTKLDYAQKAQEDCPDFQGCPGVQFCSIQAKCKRACDKTKQMCSGGNCGSKQQ